MDDDSSLSEGDLNAVHITGWDVLMAGTRSEPVPDSSEPHPEPSPVFEDRLDDFAKKVADIEVDLGEGTETPAENVQPTPVQTPKSVRIKRRKELRCP